MLLLLADLHELFGLCSEDVDLVVLGVDLLLEFEYFAFEVGSVEGGSGGRGSVGVGGLASGDGVLEVVGVGGVDEGTLVFLLGGHLGLRRRNRGVFVVAGTVNPHR